MSAELNSPPNQSFTTVEKKHWEENWSKIAFEKPLSTLNVFNSDAIKLLTEKIREYKNPIIIEIGFVPGKFLNYLELSQGAICHGYDYSEAGCDASLKFLNAQHSKVKIHCQDVLGSPPVQNPLANLVYSIGVVEHFSDPVGMLNAHLASLAVDGSCLIILPNYSGFNYKIQKLLDPDNLTIHNLETMTHSFWEKYSKKFPDHQFKTYIHGRINPWMYSFQKFGKAGRLIQLALNFLSFVCPSKINGLAGMFVIEIRQKRALD